MKNRTIATKSLHTVTSVARVAAHLGAADGYANSSETYCIQAFELLQVPGWLPGGEFTDPLFAPALKAVRKLLTAQS